jgi:hypothetical protein
MISVEMTGRDNMDVERNSGPTSVGVFTAVTAGAILTAAWMWASAAGLSSRHYVGAWAGILLAGFGLGLALSVDRRTRGLGTGILAGTALAVAVQLILFVAFAVWLGEHTT